jgi:hypothetical protein
MQCRMVHAFKEFFQLDRTLLFAMAARVWQSVAGPITIILLIQCLTLEDQGVYYGLVSVVGIQTFFELGLLNILVSQSAHLASSTQSLEGRLRLRQLQSRARQWFLVASVLFALSAMGLGWSVLSGKSVTVVWEFPLVALCLSAAAGVAISPDLAILEGAGYRHSIYRSRLLQMVSGALVVWTALLLGWKLWALVLASLVQLFWAAGLVVVLNRKLLAGFLASGIVSSTTPRLQPRKQSSPLELSWLREVLPIQWRVALVSLVYHAATQFFTLIALYFHGEADAGRLGITLTITTAIQGMSLTWIQTKFAVVSNLHGLGQRESAGTLWRRTSLISSCLLITALAVATLVISLLPWAGRGWEGRFIEPWQMAVLAMGCAANHLIAVQSFYVLAQKGRPFLLPSLVGFSLTGLAVLGGGYWYSIGGIVTGYTLVTALVTLPGHSLAYWKYRKNV